MPCVHDLRDRVVHGLGAQVAQIESHDVGALAGRERTNVGVESERARAAAKRKPEFKGWDDPADRYRTPTLDSLKD